MAWKFLIGNNWPKLLGLGERCHQLLGAFNLDAPCLANPSVGLISFNDKSATKQMSICKLKAHKPL